MMQEDNSDNKEHEYEIINLNTFAGEDLFPFIHAPLPKPIFRMIACGASGSGKTNAILNLLTRLLVYPGTNMPIFYKIFYLSPTIFMDDAFKIFNYSPLKELRENNTYEFKDKLDVDFLQRLIDGHIKLPDGTRSLVVLDDFASSLKSAGSAKESRAHQKIMQDLFFRSRHQKLSVIIMTQHYKSVPTTMRGNTSHLMVFQPTTPQAKKQMLEELTTPNHSEQRMKDFARQVYSAPYRFIWRIGTGENADFYNCFGKKLERESKKNDDGIHDEKEDSE